MHIARFHLSLAAALFALPAALSHAQSAAPEEVPAVQITGVRDPAMMPYKEAYQFLSRIGKVSGDRIESVIRVLSAKTKKPVPGLELHLRGDQTFEKIPVSAQGVVSVPLNERALADHAEFVTNQKKGTLQADLRLLPRLPSENPTYGDVLASLDAGRRAVKELIPWYLRLFVGSLKTVAICYPDNTRQVQVRGLSGAIAVRPASKAHWDTVQDQQVFCADFAAGERDIASDSVITAPPGWLALFRD